MNLFRLAGDMTHLVSIMVLLLKIHATKSCAGISLRTQELYLIVFCTRYLDLFFSFISLYNTLMKIVFITTTAAIIWYMRRHRVVSQTYSKDEETFKVQYLIGPTLLLALLVNHEFTLVEVLWTWSIYLEAVAILPQLARAVPATTAPAPPLRATLPRARRRRLQVMLQNSGNVDNLTGHYVFFLGAYRALYLLNWVYRWLHEPGYRHWIVWISGTVQTIFYVDFFYYYVKSWRNNEKLKLPN